VVLDRRGLGHKTVGFVQGFGLRDGALASSISWDVSNLVAIGANDADIAFVLNRLVEIGGGFVLVVDGKVVEELPMPVGGIISEEPVAVLAEKMARIKKAVKGIGSTVDDPCLTLQALTFTAIPAVRLTEHGLLQVKTRQILPLLGDAS